MRGKVSAIRITSKIHGITPAYAGKRQNMNMQKNAQGDHPRLCGEKCILRQSDPAAVGSPPPMRGKALETTAILSASRITPAYAGKS